MHHLKTMKLNLRRYSYLLKKKEKYFKQPKIIYLQEVGPLDS